MAKLEYRQHTGENGLCLICGRKPESPYRVYDDRGKVINGCVSQAHTGHLVQISESSFWHNRAAAKDIRRNLGYKA